MDILKTDETKFKRQFDPDEFRNFAEMSAELKKAMISEKPNPKQENLLNHFVLTIQKYLERKGTEVDDKAIRDSFTYCSNAPRNNFEDFFKVAADGADMDLFDKEQAEQQAKDFEDLFGEKAALLFTQLSKAFNSKGKFDFETFKTEFEQLTTMVREARWEENSPKAQRGEDFKNLVISLYARLTAVDVRITGIRSGPTHLIRPSVCYNDIQLSDDIAEVRQAELRRLALALLAQRDESDGTEREPVECVAKSPLEPADTTHVEDSPTTPKKVGDDEFACVRPWDLANFTQQARISSCEKGAIPKEGYENIPKSRQECTAWCTLRD